MKIEANRNAILKELVLAHEIVDAKTTIAVYQWVVLKAATGDTGVSVYSTDGQLFLAGYFAATVHKGGMVAIPAHKFLDLVKSFDTDATILLESGGKNQITLSAARFTMKLTTLDPSDFPSIKQTGDDPSVISVNASVLRRMLKQVLPSMGVSDVTYYLQGAKCEANEKGLALVSTDGHRLSLAFSGIEQARTSGDSEFSLNTIFPRKVIGALAKLIDANTETVTISVADRLHFSIASVGGDRDLYAPMAEGKYPNYRAMIPKVFNHVAVVDRAPLLDAIKRASLFGSVEATGITVSIDAEEVAVSSKTPDYGDTSEVVTATTSGDPVSAKFSPRYLVDGLEQMPTKYVRLSMKSALDQCLMEGLNSNDVPSVDDEASAEYRYVAMPQR